VSDRTGGERVTVEVAYGTPERQALVEVELAAGSTVADAIEVSGLRRDFPDLEVHPDRVGIFGKKVLLERVLEPGDRVEIYRPLLIDPKEARRARAASAGSATGGDDERPPSGS
jgi:putative ubiquitin-RnfH superfamily antitoxin RatB of RatAB toxin-antitoxin module